MTQLQDPQDRQRWLIASMQDPQVYDHAADDIELIETHISFVLLAGEYAYKIKKPLNLGFLDFSTLDKRRFFCQEELRLNHRTAPQIYRDVVPITGNAEHPHLGGDAEVIEYAVKMRRFSQDALADHLLRNDALTPHHIDQIARTLAAFHDRIEITDEHQPYGSPEQVHQPVMDNFSGLEPMLSDPADLQQLGALRQWSEEQFTAHRADFADRKRHGCIRECHGDMHLGNLALLDDEVVAFDCIEFNAGLRWIDVINEAAFLTMDLEDHGRADYAWRFINVYLETTGDYAALRLFPYYKAYRAMVRAKIARIRHDQEGLDEDEKHALENEYQGYIQLAARYARPAQPFLCITRGLSGSGKTTVARALVEQFGAVHIRSDVERKRLFGLEATQRSESGVDQGLYTQEASDRTYARLAELADTILTCGYAVIVDAAFLQQARRRHFLQLARDKGVPFAILDIQAPEAVLRSRIAPRLARGQDASEADFQVLEKQLRSQESITDTERPYTVTLDNSDRPDVTDLVHRLKEMHQAQ